MTPQKIESKMRNGQTIDAWRELRRVVVNLEENKKRVIKNSENKDGKDGE